MSSLVQFRDAIIATIKTKTGIANVQPHGGSFDEEELQRVSKTAPCILVVCDSVPETKRQGGAPVVEVGWKLFVLTRDAKDHLRGDGAVLIVQSLLALLNSQRWGLDAANGLPERQSAKNFYSGKVDNQGIALWGLAFRQRVELDLSLADANVADLLTIDTKVKQGDEIATEVITTFDPPEPP